MYFSVVEDEFYDVLNYMLSIDPKSQTFATVMTYVRRRMGGVSLVTKELVQKWTSSKHRVHSFCVLLLIYTKCLMEQTTLVEQNIDVNGIYAKFVRLFKTSVRKCFFPIADLIDWVMAGNLTDKLVLFPSTRHLQRMKLKEQGYKRTNIDTRLYCDHKNEEEIPTCPLCYSVGPLLGEQRMICQYNPDTEHTFSLTQDQIDRLSTSLINNDNDAVGLKKVKERAQQNMPKHAFSRTCRVHMIQAGPGCGKSFLIRKMATESDLVLAPFTKLMPDYKHVLGEDGVERDLLFKTTHRTMETRGCSRIFVDEFTSMPYEYLACIVELNGAKDVYLVGDVKQTKVREPDEGMYIGNYIDLDSLNTHTLVKNFRNPQDIVAILNKTYAYQMVAVSKILKSVKVVKPNDFSLKTKTLQMAFSGQSAQINTEDVKNTVRANQGGTTNSAVLYVNSADMTLPLISELQIVAMSRHTDSLTIVSDDSEIANQFLARIQIPTDEDEIKELAHPTIEYNNEVEVVDPVVDRVLPGSYTPYIGASECDTSKSIQRCL